MQENDQLADGAGLAYFAETMAETARAVGSPRLRGMCGYSIDAANSAPLSARARWGRGAILEPGALAREMWMSTCSAARQGRIDLAAVFRPIQMCEGGGWRALAPLPAAEPTAFDGCGRRGDGLPGQARRIPLGSRRWKYSGRPGGGNCRHPAPSCLRLCMAGLDVTPSGKGREA